MSKVIEDSELHRDVDAALRAAESGPVFISSDGQPVFVLLSVKQYPQLFARQGTNIAELLVSDAPVDFEPERLEFTGFRMPDFE